MLEIREDVLNQFIKIAEPNLGWSGSSPRSWAKGFMSPSDLQELPDKKFSRSELQDFCADQSISHEAAAVACMAWGGMNKKNGKDWWADRTRWTPLVSKLRNENLSREDAYRLFFDARIKGIGPAFYTKLIYFLRSKTNGYIMDQWTSKSVALLIKCIKFKTDKNGILTQSNTPETYELYCIAIEIIRDRIKNTIERPFIQADEVEAMMFSNGGHKPWEWRRYVKKNWSLE